MHLQGSNSGFCRIEAACKKSPTAAEADNVRAIMLDACFTLLLLVLPRVGGVARGAHRFSDGPAVIVQAAKADDAGRQLLKEDMSEIVVDKQSSADSISFFST